MRFAQTSGWPPAIAGLALAAIVAGFALLRSRVGGLARVRAMRWLRSVDVGTRTLAVTAVVAAGSVALALGAWPPRTRPARPVRRVAACSYRRTTPLADVTPDGTPFADEFGRGLAGTAPVHLVLGFEGVAGGPFEIVLTDATGHEHGLAGFGAGTTMGVASSRPRLELPPGPWTLPLTAAEGTLGGLRAWEAVDE